MPEAEDVLLDAAERVTAAARALWSRQRPPPVEPGVALADVERRISWMLAACFGGERRVRPIDAAPRPGRLARWFGGLTPWELAPAPEPATDGERIFLPRRLAVAATDAGNHALFRVMSLVLAERLARGSIDEMPESPIERDLFWIADGAAAELGLLRELPGLRPAILAARAASLAIRPAPQALWPTERAVEDLVRATLAAPPEASLAALVGAPGRRTAAELREWARARAPGARAEDGAYRGLAPVLHWGRPAARRAGGEAGAAARDRESDAPSRSKPASRKLARRPAIRRDDPDDDAREGPFVIPFADPQQTVQDAAGTKRLRDQGEDLELETLAEEIERLKELPLVRSDDPVREVLESEIDGARSSAPPGERVPETAVFLYPEWDHRIGGYGPRPCLLRERPLAAGDPGWAARKLDEHRELLRTVRRRFEGLRPRTRRSARQIDGDEIDLDAYVEDFADRNAGRTGSDRLYVAARPARRDVAVAFLVDASGSTDSWVSGARRVLDVAKEAILVFCEALEALRDRYAVYAFSGSRAREVSLGRIKGFAEPYVEETKARIAGLGADTFTRLGAPLRHLTAALAAEPARVRVLLLLSDGKPNDEDEYEGPYGVEDTRQAIAEARMQGIHPFCLGIRREDGPELARIFGPSGFARIASPAELPERLPEIYRLLTRRSAG